MKNKLKMHIMCVSGNTQTIVDRAPVMCEYAVSYVTQITFFFYNQLKLKEIKESRYESSLHRKA